MITQLLERKMNDAFYQRAGIQINGTEPTDIQVVKPREFYLPVLLGGSYGFGMAYVKGAWQCANLLGMAQKLFNADLDRGLWPNIPSMWWSFKTRYFNLQSQKRSWIVAKEHYDIGNDLYRAMLGPSMTYTCAHWATARNLDEAQFNKLDNVCRKLGLKQGDRVLDIGGGFGSFAYHAATYYGCTVVMVTLSQEQARFATELCAGLPVVTILLKDYRDIVDEFDHIVSLGMFEHVGHKNFRVFFKKCRSLLKPGGLLLLHTIFVDSLERAFSLDPFIGNRIFPNSMPPASEQIAHASAGVMIEEDSENRGPDYAPTIYQWWVNFERDWPELSKKYSEEFHREWRYYLLTCAAGFATRRYQLCQKVFSYDRTETYRRPAGTTGSTIRLLNYQPDITMPERSFEREVKL